MHEKILNKRHAIAISMALARNRSLSKTLPPGSAFLHLGI